MTEHGAKVEIIETYGLSDLHGRLHLAVLNLSTRLQPIVDLIEPLGIFEYSNIGTGTGEQIMFVEGCLVKMYSLIMSDGIIRNLQELHCQMLGLPNVVELKTSNMKNKYVILAPVGRLYMPENVHQLLMVLRDILQLLFYANANVTSGFLLTLTIASSESKSSFEVRIPCSRDISSHTVKVDIWSLGYLLMTCNF
ncbi:Serine/threonine protein kinase [Phytophthora megakarya]|uniref:Serine/threonine protein kinase n=1 Tax=Phytophthora megakarya TaxID=4795 RepID=A0A225UVC3_9STRA|nr:Serine/threonine protein kinase [Phytophthora megakarya]